MNPHSSKRLREGAFSLPKLTLSPSDEGPREASGSPGISHPYPRIPTGEPSARKLNGAAVPPDPGSTPTQRQKKTRGRKSRHKYAWPRGECVYFIEAPLAGLIKIGRASSLRERFSMLYAGSPIPLRLLAWGYTENGAKGTEKALHDAFRLTRAHGEWFLDTKELRAVIADAAGSGRIPATFDRRYERQRDPAFEDCSHPRTPRRPGKRTSRGVCHYRWTWADHVEPSAAVAP